MATDMTPRIGLYPDLSAIEAQLTTQERANLHMPPKEDYVLVDIPATVPLAPPPYVPLAPVRVTPTHIAPTHPMPPVVGTAPHTAAPLAPTSVVRASQLSSTQLSFLLRS